MTHANYVYIRTKYYARTFKMNYVITTCIASRGVLTSALQESQGFKTYEFDMLLLATTSLHMLTFRLMDTDFAH